MEYLYGTILTTINKLLLKKFHLLVKLNYILRKKNQKSGLKVINVHTFIFTKFTYILNYYTSIIETSVI